MKNRAKDFFQKYVNSIFLLLLLLSIFMWYMIKLGYTYTAEIPVAVDIEDNHFKVACIAEGTGYRIFSLRFFRQSEVTLSLREVQATRSVVNHDNWVIDPVSLQNAISLQNKDLKILSVGEIPEITIIEN